MTFGMVGGLVGGGDVDFNGDTKGQQSMILKATDNIERKRKTRTIETVLMDKFWQALAPLTATQRRRVISFLESMHSDTCATKEGSDDL